MKRAYIVNAVGVLSVSFAAIFIRLAEAHPIVIAFMRMAIATALLLLCWALFNREVPSRNQAWWIISSGVFLALHFITWISSFGLTSVASSVVLVTTQPLFVIFISQAFFKESIKKRAMAGIALCLIGALAIAWTDLGTGGSGTLRGNLLALMGALFAALYFTCGKKVRASLHILPYITFTYSVATMVLGLCVAMLRLPLGPFSTPTWGALLGLGVVCTIIGHSSFNYALAYLPASVVSVSTLGEPIGATLLAALLLREIPTLGQIVGGLIILVGITTFVVKPKTMSIRIPKTAK